MKNRFLLSSLMILFFGSIVILSLILFNNNETLKKNKKEELANQTIEKQKGILGAINYYNQLRADPATGTIDPQLVRQARNFSKSLSSSKSTNFNWKEMGPSNIGGRVRAFLIDKTNHSLMYAGGVSGGLWKSTTGGQSWVKIKFNGNVNVSSICQAPNGDIYVGTGEGLSQFTPTNKNTGFAGDGIYKSTDGVTFTQLSNTSSWDAINRLASDSNGKIYAATGDGLKASSNGGSTWTNENTGYFKDVKVTSDNKVYASKGGVLITSTSSGYSTTISVSGSRRLEIAISPSDNNVVYAVVVASDGSLKSIHRTTDGGSNWSQIGYGGASNFQIFGSNKQGWYDVAAMVHPTNSGIVYVGGISLWKGTFVSSGNPFGWEKISHLTEFNSYGYPLEDYIHADIHNITQHPSINNLFYIGTDGGIYSTSDYGVTFSSSNKNLNITQFYSVETDNYGNAIGGTQDNSTPYIDGDGNNPMDARELFLGDGGWAAISKLKYKHLFTTMQNGFMGRSQDAGDVHWQFSYETSGTTNIPKFFSQRMIDEDVSAHFVTPFILWETDNYQNPIDSVVFIADTVYKVGEPFYIRSTINGHPFEYTSATKVQTGDTIKTKDLVQSRFYFGATKGVWMTKEALYYGGDAIPFWFKILTTTSTVTNLEISNDGDVLFVSTESPNKLIRVSNILASQDSLTLDVKSNKRTLLDKEIFNPNGYITSISVDPQDANNVVVTLGGYSTSYDHVYYSDNALSASPTFVSKEGNLDGSLPVFASVIPIHHGKQVLIGSDFGVMATDDITASSPVWYNANSGIDDMVPVFMLRQQSDQLAQKTQTVYDEGNPYTTVFPGIINYGEIYAGTHGRGIFKSSVYVGVGDIVNSNKKFISDLVLYPNPVIDNLNIKFSTNLNKSAHLKIYNINGQLVKEEIINNVTIGVNETIINVEKLNKGLYITNIRIGNQSKTDKFIIQ